MEFKYGLEAYSLGNVSLAEIIYGTNRNKVNIEGLLEFGGFQELEHQLRKSFEETKSVNSSFDTETVGALKDGALTTIIALPCGSKYVLNRSQTILKALTIGANKFN